MKIGCAVIYEDGKILLVKKAYGDFKNFFEFPGGKKKSNETIQNCIQREVLEEIGCKSKILELIYDYTTSNLHLLFHKVKLLTNNIQLSKEHTDYTWLSVIKAKEGCFNGLLIRSDYEFLEYLEKYEF